MRKLTTEQFISKATEVHGGLYSYKRVVYKESQMKVEIHCSKHGYFFQKPAGHLRGRGCLECEKERRKTMSYDRSKKTALTFIERAKNIHGDIYDYSLSKYINSSTLVKVICKNHGMFEIKPSLHTNGTGCPKCGIEKRSLKKHLNKKLTYFDRVSETYNNKYDYSLSEYTGIRCILKIVCPVHGIFEKTALKHLQGQGCPQCSVHGFKKNLPAILYYLKINCKENGILYKIGITNSSVEERYKKKDLPKIEVLKTWDYAIGNDAVSAERKILNTYKDYLYQGEPPLDGVGIAEIFAEDILGLAI